jgi:hypothetical protein
MLPLRPQHLERAEPEPRLSRRQLLVRGAVATGALFISGAIVRFAALLNQGPKEGRRVLSRREIEILNALTVGLFPPGGEMPGADVDFIVPRVDRFLENTDPDARILFRAMLHVIEDQSRLFRFCAFSKLPLEAREAEIRAWERTRVYTKRMAFSSVKLFIGMYYFEQPGVHESIGWYLGCSPSDRDPVDKEGLG